MHDCPELHREVRPSNSQTSGSNRSFLLYHNAGITHTVYAAIHSVIFFVFSVSVELKMLENKFLPFKDNFKIFRLLQLSLANFHNTHNF